MDTMTQGTENISVNLSLNAQRDTVLYRNVSYQLADCCCLDVI